MCYALVEGLAGVVDEGKTFRQVRLSPRWTAAARKAAEVQCVYGASGASFGYIYAHDPIRRTIDLETAGKAKVHLHLLLPKEITRCAFWAGEPDFPLAPTGKTRQHNFFVGGGAFWRF